MINLPWRGILFYSFVALFFIIGIALLLYGTGYRYSQSKRMFEKTGELVVESRPNGASVFLDGNDTGKKTPAYIKYILPGKYRLTIRKDGHFLFAQEIVILQGIVVIIDEVVLARDIIPTALFTHPQPIQEISAITSKYIFFKTENAFFSYDRTHKQTKELARAREPFTVLSSPNNRSFYVYSKKSAFVIKKDTQKAISSFVPTQEPLKIFAWSDDEYAYGITQKGIFRLDPATGGSRYIAKGVFRDILLQNGFINTIQERGNSVDLVQYALSNQPFERKRYEIPKNAVQFVKNTYPFVILATESREFISFDQKNLQPPTPISEIQKFVFPLTPRAIAISEFEIWLFTALEKNQKRLILRQSKPIVKAILIPDVQYAFVATDDSLELVETRDHPLPNRYEIFSSSKLEDSAFSQKEKRIFFSVSFLQGSRVYERLLVD